MSSRAAASGAATAGEAGPRARLRADDPAALTDALSVLNNHTRDLLLEAVASAAKELLRSSDLNISLPEVSERIGRAIGVDRTHIFLIDAASGNGKIL